MLLDGALALAVYLLAYRLRFSGEALAAFLPGAWETAAVVAAGLVLGAWAAGVYRERPIGQKVRRLLIGSALGLLAAVAIIGAVAGFEGLSRSAFATTWFLFLLLAVGWRAVRVLAATRALAERSADDLVDRTIDQATMAETIWSVVTYRELVRNLVFKDLKLKYRGSVLGFLWSLIHPVALLLVYTMAFKFVMRSPQPDFLLFLLIGILAWTFFAGSLTMATGSIVDAGSLMKGVKFPRAILPLSTVLFNLAQYLLTVVVLLPILLAAHGILPTATMLLFPVFLVLQVIYIAGLAFLVAAATTFFRDVRHLLDISLALLFWTTPIVYPLTQVPERAQSLFLLSPMSPFVVAYQRILYDRQWPELWLWVLVVTYAATAGAAGLAVFLSVEDKLSERL